MHFLPSGFYSWSLYLYLYLLHVSYTRLLGPKIVTQHLLRTRPSSYIPILEITCPLAAPLLSHRKPASMEHSATLAQICRLPLQQPDRLPRRPRPVLTRLVFLLCGYCRAANASSSLNLNLKYRLNLAGPRSGDASSA